MSSPLFETSQQSRRSPSSSPSPSSGKFWSQFQPGGPAMPVCPVGIPTMTVEGARMGEFNARELLKGTNKHMSEADESYWAATIAHAVALQQYNSDYALHVESLQKTEAQRHAESSQLLLSQSSQRARPSQLSPHVPPHVPPQLPAERPEPEPMEQDFLEELKEEPHGEPYGEPHGASSQPPFGVEGVQLEAQEQAQALVIAETVALEVQAHQPVALQEVAMEAASDGADVCMHDTGDGHISAQPEREVEREVEREAEPQAEPQSRSLAPLLLEAVPLAPAPFPLLGLTLQAVPSVTDIIQQQIDSTEELLRKALQDEVAARKAGSSSSDRQAIQLAAKALQQAKAQKPSAPSKGRPAMQAKGLKRPKSDSSPSPPPKKKLKATVGSDTAKKALQGAVGGSLQGMDQVEDSGESQQPFKKKHQKQKKTPQGGGAAPPRLREFPLPQETAHVIEKLAPLDPSPLLKEKYVLYRQNEIRMPKPEGRSCCFDAFCAATGTTLSRARVKKLRAGKETDMVPENCMATLKPNPFRLVKKDCTWRHLIEECKEGIHIVRFSFIDYVTEKVDKHFIAVDCWRGLIMDDGEARPIPFLGRTGKKMMKRLQGASMERAWTVLCASHLVHLTHYV